METESTPTRDLAAQGLEVCLCFHARRGARAITQIFDQVLAPTGLKASQVNLLMLAGSRDSASVGDLARALGADSTTLSRTLKPLESQGLLTVARSEADRRTKHVFLTDDGHRALGAALPLWQSAQSAVVRRLGSGIVQTLLSGLEATAHLGETGQE